MQLHQFDAYKNFFRHSDSHNLDNVLENFFRFCLVDRQLSKTTAHRRMMDIKRFFEFLNGRPITRETIRQYLGSFRAMSPHTYKRELSSLRIFVKDYLEQPDLIRTFRFPKIHYKPIIAPKKEDIQKLYDALNIKYKTLLIMYAATGLRECELLSVTFDQMGLDRRMIIVGKNSNTKRTWVTFFNEEARAILKQYLATRKDKDERLFPIGKASVNKMLRKTSEKVGVHITPQKLRDWFCVEMGELGVQDRYIDAFCGRVPKSILARHYTDYSPERLRRIYDRANLKVLS